MTDTVVFWLEIGTAAMAMMIPGGLLLIVLKDWLLGSPWLGAVMTVGLIAAHRYLGLSEKVGMLIFMAVIVPMMVLAGLNIVLRRR